MSRIGKLPIALPKGVDVNVSDKNVVTVKGAKGTLTQKLDAAITIKNEGGVITV
ncbi:MAG: 50S ribosomal protein L6, partial [Bacteroidetes bacterium]|nr:50S ribosomal protein L6 [Bacteroidota bacterium]